MRRLRESGASGATCLRGIWGFHGDHAPHGDRLLQLRRRVPIVTIVIDTPERIAESFEIVDELTDEAGLVTSEMVPAMAALTAGGASARRAAPGAPSVLTATGNASPCLPVPERVWRTKIGRKRAVPVPCAGRLAMLFLRAMRLAPSAATVADGLYRRIPRVVEVRWSRQCQSLRQTMRSSPAGSGQGELTRAGALSALDELLGIAAGLLPESGAET